MTMKRLVTSLALTLPLLVLLAGCGDSFPDEEMHLGLELKTRPYGIIIEPPEAHPGQEVQVTLLGHTPSPSALEISWQVALDYDLGLYEVDEIERNFRPVPAGSIAFDDDGFFTQTFTWTVPDSALIHTSALGEVITDEFLAGLATMAMAATGDPVSDPPLKSEVDSWLKDLTSPGIDALGPEDRFAVLALVDRFACQIRLRATLDDGNLVDATKNLTVRHSGRLPSTNINLNTEVTSFRLVALHKRNAETADLDDESIKRTVFDLGTSAEQPGAPLAIPFDADRSYFLEIDHSLQIYDAPYEMGIQESEGHSQRWYYFRRDDPRSAAAFFVNDDGDPAEMFDLDERARIDPDGVGSEYRVVAVPRDGRDDWRAFHATPGTGLAQAWLLFVEP
jgi:hypothetical protein